MTLHYSLRRQVAWIRLDRPAALNALNFAMLEALQQAFERAEADTQARVVVLTGTGRAFCAGGDIHQLHGEIRSPGVGPSYIEAVTRAFGAVRALSKPLVGGVNGLAVGGGLELVLHCDLVVAADDAKLGDGHANFGIFPGGGASALLPRRLPLNLAKQLLFTGGMWPAEEWHRMGVINRLVPRPQLEEAVQALAEELAVKSPVLLRRLKAVADATAEQTLQAAFDQELRELRAQMATADMREGTAAFIEKRVPHYSSG